MQYGARLGDLGSGSLTWSDLAAIIAHPRRGGPLFRALHGDDADWASLDAQLLATIADALHHISWQLAGDKQAARPGRIPRPGVEGHKRWASDPLSDDDAYTMDELDELSE